MRRKRHIIVVKRIRAEAKPSNRVRLTRDSFPIPHPGDESDDLPARSGSSPVPVQGSPALHSLLKGNRFTLDHMALEHEKSRAQKVRLLSPETKSKDRSWLRILSQ